MTCTLKLNPGWRPFSKYWWFYWLNPKSYWRWATWNVQRARRGFSDHDVWGLCDYLGQMIPDALEALKHDSLCYPSDLTPEEWDVKLDTMAAGFRAAVDILDLSGCPENLDKSKEWFRSGKHKKWEEEREAVRKKGFAEFDEWFLGLWD